MAKRMKLVSEDEWQEMLAQDGKKDIEALKKPEENKFNEAVMVSEKILKEEIPDDIKVALFGSCSISQRKTRRNN